MRLNLIFEEGITISIETYDVLKDLNELSNDNHSQGSLKKLFHDYEEVVVKSLITSFGLDFMLIKDRHGGDVDTIHNVREIQKENARINDGQQKERKFDGYANKKNEAEYDRVKGSYDKTVSGKYHTNKDYKQRNEEASVSKKAGTQVDAYSGKRMKRNSNMDLDHTISAKEIHEDAGRVLAGVDGVELANKKSNLNHTDQSINRSKKALSVDEFTDRLDSTRIQRQQEIQMLRKKDSLTDKERGKLNKLEKLESVDIEKMKAADKKARAAYEREIASKYYSSSKFINDTLSAGYKKGMQMGMRQALGTILAAAWMCIREEVPKLVAKLKDNFELGAFFKGLVEIIQKAFIRVKAVYKDVIQSFSNGALSGIISSLVTALTNIFFTTAKNVGKIIRESWASIVEAVNILLFNPNNLPFGEVLKAVSVIICTASSVILGTVVSEAMSKIPALQLPIIGDVLPKFVGALVTGLMSISLLYFLDHSKMVQTLVDWVNKLKTQSDYKIEYYQKVHAEISRYAAELADIDYEEFNNQILAVQFINQQLKSATNTIDMNTVLTKIVEKYGIDLPYDRTIKGLDDFMQNKNAVLTFKL
ncbi:hypothetical protein MKY34_18355 [Sporosarcina sp. FSL K6-1522]|uniref:hypothetical protein n=1 Tax=Sporosarcina sp. FSL K6-1522 TaxID=2921554 RepID=UPI003159E44F